MGLFRNDRNKMPRIFRRCNARELEEKMRKRVNCTAVIKTFILQKIFSTDIIYKQQKITRR